MNQLNDLIDFTLMIVNDGITKKANVTAVERMPYQQLYVPTHSTTHQIKTKITSDVDCGRSQIEILKKATIESNNRVSI